MEMDIFIKNWFYFIAVKSLQSKQNYTVQMILVFKLMIVGHK